MEKRDDRRSVYEIAQVLRSLNGLSESVLQVSYGSHHEITYKGEKKLSELIIPEGYRWSTYCERGTKMPCITNQGNTASGMYRTFVVRTC